MKEADDEKRLISLAKDGDEDAFTILLERYRSMIFNIAFCIAKNEHDAKDMAQEVFVKIYKNINKFEGRSKFSTWVFRVAKNTCIDELKRIVRTQEKNLKSEEISKEFEARMSRFIPEEQILKNEFNNFVHSLLNELAPLYREIITLRYIRGLPYNEIAKILDCSEGTVKSRLYRGKKNLKKIIDEKIKNFD